MPLPVNVPKCWLSERRGRCVLRGVGEHTSASRLTSTKIGDSTIYARRVLDRWLDELAGRVPVGMARTHKFGDRNIYDRPVLDRTCSDG
jgi:hypothetical protein